MSKKLKDLVNDKNSSTYVHERLLDKHELSSLLGCCPQTVEAMRNNKEIPFVKVRSLIKFIYSDVIYALKNQKAGVNQ